MDSYWGVPMVNKLVSGDYVPDGFGGFVRQTQQEALLSQALFRLSARRGKFPFLQDLGSRLYLLGQEKPPARQMVARQYCIEALQGLDVAVVDVKLTPEDDGIGRLEVTLQAGMDTAEVEVTI